MNKTKNIVLIILFAMALLLPTIVQITGVEQVILKGDASNREAFPKADLKQPKQFVINLNNYYTSHFGLRNTLFNTYKHFTQDVLKENPLPTKVIKGKNNWLFLGDSDSNVLAESLGYVNFSKIELNQITKKIEAQKNWLTKKGVGYYIAVAPNKHTIYKESLPFKASKKETKRLTLKKYLKKAINFDLIDLTEPLILNKNKQRLFYSHDTHWNDYGAFLGYQKIIDEIKKNYPIIQQQIVSPSEIIVDTITYAGGDLNRMLNNGTREKRTLLKKKGATSQALKKQLPIPSHYNRSPDIYEYRYKNDSKKLKILVFRDSFTQALRKYINESFNESVYIWDFTFDKTLIEKEKPDIVLYVVVERYIERLNN